jgi:hypothetical protein
VVEVIAVQVRHHQGLDVVEMLIDFRQQRNNASRAHAARVKQDFC